MLSSLRSVHTIKPDVLYRLKIRGSKVEFALE